MRAFLGELIDHAPLFPPAQLAMPEALAAHERAEAGPHFWMLGRFVIAASRVPELIGVLERDDAPGALPVSLVLDGDPGSDLAAVATLARDHAGRIDVESVEARFGLVDQIGQKRFPRISRHSPSRIKQAQRRSRNYRLLDRLLRISPHCWN